MYKQYIRNYSHKGNIFRFGVGVFRFVHYLIFTRRRAFGKGRNLTGVKKVRRKCSSNFTKRNERYISAGLFRDFLDNILLFFRFIKPVDTLLDKDDDDNDDNRSRTG